MSDIFNHEADAWDSLDWDDESTNWKSKRPTCKYCKTQKVIWQQTDIGWRLFNYDMKLHTCDAYKLRRKIS